MRISSGDRTPIPYQDHHMFFVQVRSMMVSTWDPTSERNLFGRDFRIYSVRAAAAAAATPWES